MLMKRQLFECLAVQAYFKDVHDGERCFSCENRKQIHVHTGRDERGKRQGKREREMTERGREIWRVEGLPTKAAAMQFVQTCVLAGC